MKRNITFIKLQSQSLAQKGMTIVELMVSMLIGLLLLLVVSVVFTQGRVAGRAIEGTQDVQEGARYALDRVSYYLRTARQAGCSRGGGSSIGLSAKPKNTDDIASFLLAAKDNSLDPTTTNNNLLTDKAFIQAYDSGIGFTVPGGSALVPASAVDAAWGLSAIPDALFLTGASSTFSHLASPITNIAAGVFSISTPLPTKGQNTELFLISNCVQGEIIYGSQNLSATNPAISYDNLSNYQSDLTFPYGGQSTIAKLEVHNYFVAPGPNFARDGYVLYEQTIAANTSAGAAAYQVFGTPQPIVSRVSRFNIEFGVDTDAPTDGVVNQYVRPSAVADWSRVIQARVTLGVLGADKNTAQGPNAGIDGRVQQIYTVQVEIRN